MHHKCVRREVVDAVRWHRLVDGGEHDAHRCFACLDINVDKQLLPRVRQSCNDREVSYVGEGKGKGPIRRRKRSRRIDARRQEADGEQPRGLR